MQLQNHHYHHHHSVAVRVSEQMGGSKRGSTFIQANRAWLPKLYLLWVMAVALFALMMYNGMDDDNKVRRKEVLGSMCDQRARMLQDQFSVSVNHVHALAILVSTFHYFKDPSAIDQVCASSWWVLLHFFWFRLAINWHYDFVWAQISFL